MERTKKGRQRLEGRIECADGASLSEDDRGKLEEYLHKQVKTKELHGGTDNLEVVVSI